MATRVRPKAEKLYEQDFYVGTEVRAGLRRQRRFETLDLDNLIEEVEGLGDAKKTAVLSAASVIVEHLLKLQLPPPYPPTVLTRSTRSPGLGGRELADL